MRLAAVSVLALSFFQQQHCGLTRMMSPQAIQQQAEQAFQPYFPRVHVLVRPQEGLIIANTCASLGPSAISALPATISQNSSLKELALIHSVGLLPYRFVALGFEDSILRYDLETKAFGVIQAGAVSGWDQYFSQACAQKVAVADAPATEYVWIGVWGVTYQDASGSQTTTTWTDSLGVYRQENFQAAEQAEIAGREEAIKNYFAIHNAKIVSFQFQKLGRQPYISSETTWVQ